MRSDETLELYGTDWLTDWTLDTYVEELITLERVAARPGEAHDALQLEQCPGQCALRPIRQKFAQAMGFHVEKKRWVRCPKCAHWTCTGCAKNLLGGKPADIALGSDPKSRPAEWQFKCIVCSQKSSVRDVLVLGSLRGYYRVPNQVGEAAGARGFSADTTQRLEAPPAAVDDADGELELVDPAPDDTAAPEAAPPSAETQVA